LPHRCCRTNRFKIATFNVNGVKGRLPRPGDRVPVWIELGETRA
jgi:hypothetical protein